MLNSKASGTLAPVAGLALQNIKNNQLAADTRMGGKWTTRGLEKATVAAQANGADRLQIENLYRMGLGGSLYNGA